MLIKQDKFQSSLAEYITTSLFCITIIQTPSMLSLYPIDRLKLFLTPSSQITPHWHQKVTWSTRYSRRNVHRNLKKPSANLTFTWFRQPSIMSMY